MPASRAAARFASARLCLRPRRLPGYAPRRCGACATRGRRVPALGLPGPSRPARGGARTHKCTARVEVHASLPCARVGVHVHARAYDAYARITSTTAARRASLRINPCRLSYNHMCTQARVRRWTGERARRSGHGLYFFNIQLFVTHD